jgi:hypothetical protein
MLLLRARLVLNTLLQIVLLLHLLGLHLILHPLLAGHHVPRLIGVIVDIDGCARTLSGSSAARYNMLSCSPPHFVGSLKFTPFRRNNDFLGLIIQA